MGAFMLRELPAVNLPRSSSVDSLYAASQVLPRFLAQNTQEPLSLLQSTQLKRIIDIIESHGKQLDEILSFVHRELDKDFIFEVKKQLHRSTNFPLPLQVDLTVGSVSESLKSLRGPQKKAFLVHIQDENIPCLEKCHKVVQDPSARQRVWDFRVCKYRIPTNFPFFKTIFCFLTGLSSQQTGAAYSFSRGAH